MKNCICLLSLLFFIACEPTVPKGATPVDPKSAEPSEQIDAAVEDAKDLLNVFNKHAKDFLEGEEIDKIKDLADDLKGKGQELLKDTTILKAKLEELKEDEDIKVLLEKYKKESEDIFKSIEDILGAIDDDKK
jgi:hypothetical protein